MTEFYDAHLHTPGAEAGGFLIALTGAPRYPDTLDNTQVLSVGCDHPLLIPVQYVSRDGGPTVTPVVKYHARREGFDWEAVAADIATRAPRLAIVDTLNEPHWTPRDYWLLAKRCAGTQFLMAHGGGYAAPEFVKLCDFQPNVWLDFSLTQEYFGWCGTRPRFGAVADALDYSLTHPKLSRRILFGSDRLFWSQELALSAYLGQPHAAALLRDNFLSLLRQLGLVS